MSSRWGSDAKMEPKRIKNNKKGTSRGQSELRDVPIYNIYIYIHILYIYIDIYIDIYIYLYISYIYIYSILI